MATPSMTPKDSPQAARAGYAGLGVDSHRPCPACGKPLPEGRAACGGRCRAELSRVRRVTRLRAGLLTMQAHLEDLVDLVGKLHGPRRTRR